MGCYCSRGGGGGGGGGAEGVAALGALERRGLLEEGRGAALEVVVQIHKHRQPRQPVPEGVVLVAPGAAIRCGDAREPVLAVVGIPGDQFLAFTSTFLNQVAEFVVLFLAHGQVCLFNYSSTDPRGSTVDCFTFRAQAFSGSQGSRSFLEVMSPTPMPRQTPNSHGLTIWIAHYRG